MSRNLFYLLFVFIVGFSIKTYSQHPSETVIEKEKYGSDILWSCKDKHFGYYFINYSIPLRLENGIENELNSHLLNIGYSYRYKVVNVFDIGMEVAYANRTSGIKQDSIMIFDPGTFYNHVKTYQNGLSTSVFMRFTFAANSHRNLGYFMDIGAYYNYYLWYGIQYKLKNTDIYQKARFRKSEYVTNSGYGAFIKFAMNNVGITFTYSLSDWISGFSNQDLCFTRSPFMVGLQFNLYTK